MLILQILLSSVFVVHQTTCSTTTKLRTSNFLGSSNLWINFQPYVSILDRYNNSRYGVDDLIPLVSLVASRFKRFYITLDVDEIIRGDTNSLLLSPHAVGKYNCLSTTKTKVEVIIQIATGRKLCNCSNFEIAKNVIESFADKVNDECEGTIKTIVKRYCDWEKAFVKCETNYSKPNIIQKYQWAVQKPSFENMNNHTYEHFLPELVVLSYTDLEVFMRAKRKRHLASPVNSLQGIKSVLHAFDFTDQYFNLSGYISNWNSIFDIQEDQQLLVNSAFDLPPPITYSPYYKPYSSGWWYLVNDTGNTDTTLFTFEEKFAVASIVDHEEDPKNFEWLYKEIIFNQMKTGIVVGVTTIGYLLNSFTRVYVLDDEKFPTNIFKEIPDFPSTSKPNLDLVSTSSIDMLSLAYYRYNLKNISKTILGRSNFSIQNDTFTFQYDLEEYSNFSEYIFEYGYSFHLDICGYNTKWQANTILMDVIKDPKSRMYLFYYNETEVLVESGANRLFQRLKVMFEKCQNLVFANGDNPVEIAFALEGYFMTSDFYRSPRQLQNYVKYISLLNNWVAGQTNTVIYLGQGHDTMRSFRTGEVRKPTVGRYSTNMEKPSFLSDKQQDALELSLRSFSEENVKQVSTLSSTLVTSIVLASLALSGLLIALTILFTRRYYAKTSFTAEEIEKFLNGENSGEESIPNADNLPYNKEMYEIPTNKFTILNELGSGEFGKVYRGKILSESNDITVAVKTCNLKTFHKTVLSGLLSEIKVLAYLGKHKHIVELVGANTENLKLGKVYVFLELCQLGSLDNILIEMGQRINSNNLGCTATENGFVYGRTGTTKMLDVSSSDNLYKWSVEICNGMVYLAEKHVVHADIATRNVLLNLRKEAKICDFGLSRRMYNYTNYVKSQQEPLPWKWMAPEALNYMTFSEKSDVWAYGVTLWEIYSLGKCPYPGLSWDPNFAGMLERGLRLSEPEFNDKNMYSVMTKCWATEDKQRPTFLELYELLVNLQILTAEIVESAV